LGGSTTWANIRGLLTNNIEGIKIYEGGDFKSNTEDVWGISDKNLFLESSEILSANKNPFFAIIQTAGNHRPYTIPEEDLDEFNKVNISHDSLIKFGFENNEELNAFRYMDFSIQKFMEAAARTKYYDNTIFVFVGDHGIAGNAGNILPMSYTQQNLLAEHVPLLFFSNKYLSAKKINDVCSQIDILPSIASIAKQSYTNSTLGRSLFDLENLPKFAFITDPDRNSTGVVSNEYYFVKYNSGPSKFVSILNNADVIVNPSSDSIKNYMEKLTDGIQETSKYLLLNNKKRN
ncbi:MAG: sulfatase-like hydrolase/transferase, partial [Ferruginibacter sp.]